MATRKRKSSRSRPSGLVGRAVTAGRKALREAESRVPPDLRRQLERSIKDGQKTLKTAIDQLQAQVRSRAKQADIDKVLKRLDRLSKQVQQVALGTSSRAATTAKRTARSTTRRASARKPATRKAATTRKPVTRKASPRSTATARPSSSGSATRRTAPRRAPTRRTSATAAEPTAPPASAEPSWMPESSDSGGTSS